MSSNFCASFDLAHCYDHHQPPQPQQHHQNQQHQGVMAASMDQQCYQSADQTRNSNPDMLDTYGGGHHHLEFGAAAAHHQGGGGGEDMPNGFHAALGKFRSNPDRQIRVS